MALPDDFVLPVGHVVHTGVPTTMRRHVSQAATGRQEAFDLAYRLGGRDARPTAPVLIWGPDNRTPIMIIGDGVTEAAELEDIALEAIDNQAESVKNNGRGMDYDQFREDHGMMRRDEVPAAIKNAIADRIAKHKANPVSDPFRQPQKPRGVHQGVDVPKGK